MEIYVDICKKLNEFDLNIRFQSSGTIGLLGSSGSGKSMTLKSIAGIEKPDQGIIKINGNTVFDSERKINLPPQKRNIGFVFQNYALFPHMTVYQNICFGIKNKNNKKKIEDIIEKIEISSLLNRYPRELSGGQQQRVAIARVLARDPKVLLFDEPLSALDTYLKAQLEEWLDTLIKDFKGPTVFVSHNIGEVSRICDNIAILSRGDVIEFGDTHEVLYSPKTLQTATIAGCKNISQASIHDDSTIQVKDWGIYLKINKPIPKNTRHMGIYSKDVLFGKRDINGLSCKVKEVTKDLNCINLYLIPPTNQGLIHLELSPREFENMDLSSSVDINIPPDKIMLLK